MKTSRVGTQGAMQKHITHLSELQKRFVSGFILISLLLFLTLYNDITFSILIIVSSLIILWEWMRIVRQTTFDASFIMSGMIIFLSSLLSSKGYYFEALSILLLGFLLAMIISRRKFPLLSSLGIFYAGLPAVALLWIKQDDPFGLPAILYIFCVVIGTDTASYFIGRSIGGRKLAPTISPNKTWSGFIGGIFVPFIIALGISILTKCPYSIVLTTPILALLCQLGDLSESYLKRKFHIKDSSNLIPGHGGLLDRVDGLIFSALGAGLLSLIINPAAPAEGLLFWSLST